LGFVNKNDIDRLLILQKENRDLLGEILVLHGAISKMDMEEELRQFYELKGRNKE
jgi:hypothetical protein